MFNSNNGDYNVIIKQLNATITTIANTLYSNSSNTSDLSREVLNVFIREFGKDGKLAHSLLDIIGYDGFINLGKACATNSHFNQFFNTFLCEEDVSKRQAAQMVLKRYNPKNSLGNLNLTGYSNYFKDAINLIEDSLDNLQSYMQNPNAYQDMNHELISVQLQGLQQHVDTFKKKPTTLSGFLDNSWSGNGNAQMPARFCGVLGLCVFGIGVVFLMVFMVAVFNDQNRLRGVTLTGMNISFVVGLLSLVVAIVYSLCNCCVSRSANFVHNIKNTPQKRIKASLQKIAPHMANTITANTPNEQLQQSLNTLRRLCYIFKVAPQLRLKIEKLVQTLRFKNMHVSLARHEQIAIIDVLDEFKVLLSEVKHQYQTHQLLLLNNGQVNIQVNDKRVPTGPEGKEETDPLLS